MSETYSDPFATGGHYEPGYSAGASAGAINITAVTPVLDGALVADIVTGARQRALAQGGGTATQTSLAQLPTGASLNVTFGLGSSYSVVLEPQAAAGSDPYGLSNFSLATAASWTPSLTGNEISRLHRQPVRRGLRLHQHHPSKRAAHDSRGQSHSAAGRRVTLSNVTEIDGAINAPSGSIALAGYQPTPPSTGVSGGPPLTLDLIIGSTAVLNVRGLWANDTGAYDALQGAAFVNGGSVSIITPSASTYTTQTIASGVLADGTNVAGLTIVTSVDVTQSIVLAPGSVIDASSGGYVGANGRLKYGSDGLPLGKGGSVTLQTYAGALNANGLLTAGGLTPFADSYQGRLVGTATAQNPVVLADGSTVAAGATVDYFNPNNNAGNSNVPSASYLPTDGVPRANVVMGGSIYAAGFDGGGTFSLETSSIRIVGGGGPAISYLPSASLAGIATATGQPASAYTNAGTNNAGASPALVAVLTTRSGIDLRLRSSQTTPSTPMSSPAPTAMSPWSRTRPSTCGSRACCPAACPARPDIQQPSGAIPQAFEAFGPAADGLLKPVSLTLFDPGGLGGILIGAGAAINADPRASGPASISLTGAMVTVLGSITAPFGSISLLSGGGPVIDIGPVSNPPPATAQDVWIGSNAVLDVSAMFIPNPRIAAYATGSLLDAGTITLDGPTVVTQPGSQLLLRGGVATIDVAGGGGAPGASRFASETIWSNGGTLQLAGIGIGNLYFAGAVDAAGGAPLAAGGSLIIGNAADFSGASEPSILIIEPGGVVAANLPATAAYPLTRPTSPR